MAYGNFAQVYDRIIAHDYVRTAEYIRALLDKFQAGDTKTVVDLGCGTGSLCYLLSGHYNVVGVDNSASMLKAALDKYGAVEGLNFRAGDMTEVELGFRADAFLSTLDAVNYLLWPEQVAACFSRVAAQLRSGGLLIFDISTAKAFAAKAANNFVYNGRDVFYTIESMFTHSKTICRQYLTIFYKDKGIYHKVTELHKQRIYSAAWLLETLRYAGLTPVGVFNAYSDLNLQKNLPSDIDERFNRLFIVSQKSNSN